MKKFLLSISVFLIGLTSGTAFLNSLPIVVGATIPTSVALFETSLANSLTASGTSMTLVSATTKDGTTLSGTYAFIIDEGTNVEEFVIADCTLTACSNMTRGVSVISGTSSVTALKKAHRRGASVKITDAPQLLILSRVLNGQDTIPNSLSYDSSPVFSSALQIITKGYADALVAAGVATSSESNFGGVWLATQVQMASSTDGGVNKPYVLQSKYATSSCPTTGNWVPITNASTGKLAVGCIDQTGNYTWSGLHTFSGSIVVTGTSTLASTTITDLSVSGSIHGYTPDTSFRLFETSTTSPGYVNIKATSSTASTTYYKTKEVTMPNVAGTTTVYFELASSAVAQNAYAQIYVNGVAAGTERSFGNTNYVPYEETIAIPAGAKIQIYQKATSGYVSYIRNARIHYGVAFVETINLN